MEENQNEIATRAREEIENWRDTAETYYSDLQDRLIEADKRVRSVVKARPLACVAGAFAVGFLTARAFRMWRS